MPDTHGIERNRQVWSIVNQLHTDAASQGEWLRTGVHWGLFRIPESELAVLPAVTGQRVVELGAGTAFLSAALARQGADVIAIDVSHEQLLSAARCQRLIGPHFPLVEADGGQVPLSDQCADMVISEHGASVWCDPAAWIPEAARLLKPGGWLVFLTNSVLSTLCVPEQDGPADDRLHRPQRDLYRTEWEGGGIEFHPSHSQWIAILRRSGFRVDAMHELYAPDDAFDPAFYQIADSHWARRWPVEDLWVARRVGQ